MADQPKRGPGPFHGPGPRRALVAVAVVGRGRAWSNDDGRVCIGLAGLAADAWAHAGPLYEGSGFQWSDFDTGLVDKVRSEFPDLPPPAVALALRIWGHLHGLVSLEIYGHLLTQTLDPDKLYREELAQLVRSLGLATHH
jgi:hypothetical protein